MAEQSGNSELLVLTTDIVASHVANNSVAVSEVPQLIRQVYNALADVDGVAPPEPEPPKPAVPIRKSVTPDYIVCLEDGKRLKMLKRHIRTRYDLTPDEYRERWGLAPDYPMVAPNYASRRSALAKKIGLGKKRHRRRK